MNDNSVNKEFVHLYVALRRTKDNPEKRGTAFREIILNEEVDLARLKLRCLDAGGFWRIQKTINSRDVKKAMNLFRKEIVGKEAEVATYLPTFWKSMLLNKKAKSERNILLDIDSEEAYSSVKNIIKDNNIPVLHETPSVSGHHIVINAEQVDTRLFKNIDDVSFQRDGLVFVEAVGESDAIS